MQPLNINQTASIDFICCYKSDKIMEILWKTLPSEKTGRMSKQHAYVPRMSAGGNKRNKTLCKKFHQINEDEEPEYFDKMDGELLLVADACKICLNRYNKLSE